MSPEQWRGERPDPKTDQYALAMVAYELIAGHLPFEPEDSSQLRECALNQDIPHIEGVSEQVMAALRRGLAKHGSDRFPNCISLIEALEAKPEDKPAIEVVHFCETMSSSTVGKAVAIDADGIFIHSKKTKKLEFIPFSSISSIVSEKETRTWRLIWVTGAFLGSVIATWIGCVISVAVFEGEITGTGAWAMMLLAPMGAFGCLVSPILYFIPLGVYLYFKANDSSYKFYFDRDVWIEKRNSICECISLSGCLVTDREQALSDT